jgi:hypothetical protein
MAETSKKLCVHEFDFSICCIKKAKLKADFLAILGTGFLDTSLQNICVPTTITATPDQITQQNSLQGGGGP